MLENVKVADPMSLMKWEIDEQIAHQNEFDSRFELLIYQRVFNGFLADYKAKVPFQDLIKKHNITPAQCRYLHRLCAVRTGDVPANAPSWHRTTN